MQKTSQLHPHRHSTTTRPPKHTTDLVRHEPTKKAPTKSKIILLANCTREHQHTPQPTLDNVAISHKHSTQILGVTYDTSLSFKDHIYDIKQKCTHRLNTLRTLTGTDFGQHTSVRFWNTPVLLGPQTLQQLTTTPYTLYRTSGGSTFWGP